VLQTQEASFKFCFVSFDLQEYLLALHFHLPMDQEFDFSFFLGSNQLFTPSPVSAIQELKVD
jgi:hypothetical protein